MSPDPIIMNDLRILNPQRWNKYSYTINNPLTLTDPTGEDAVAVNFSTLVGRFGHEAIVSTYQRQQSGYRLLLRLWNFHREAIGLGARLIKSEVSIIAHSLITKET